MEDGDYSTHDFDLMDQILYDGFWLETETCDGSDLSQPISNHHLTSPPLHESINSSNTNSPHQDKDFSKESTGKSNFFGESSFNHPPLMEDDLSASGQARNHVSSALNHHSNLLVGPDRNNSVKKRFDQAIEHLKDCVRERAVLIQIWIPVKKEGKQVLITNNQPFFTGFKLQKPCRIQGCVKKLSVFSRCGIRRILWVAWSGFLEEVARMDSRCSILQTGGVSTC